MKRSAAYWLAACAVIAALFWLYLRPSGSRGTGPAALAGERAPSFLVAALGGGESGLAAYRGRIVVLNLWASWCPPCRAEMPDLETLYRRYRSRGVVVLGVDQGESAQQVAAFAQSLRITYPILLDDQQQYGRVYAALGLPTTILVGPNGIVRRGFDGPLTYPQMVAAVGPLLRAK